MFRQLLESIADAFVTLRIAGRFGQPLAVRSFPQFLHPLEIAPSRFEERFDFRDSRQEIALARKPINRVDSFSDQMLRVARKELNQSRRVNLRVAREYLRVEPDQALRRFGRHLQVF